MRSSRSQLQSLARRWSAQRPSLTFVLVAWSVAVACAQWILFVFTSDRVFAPEVLNGLLGLSADSVANGSDWQFATFSLVHGGLLHLLANMIPLFYVGREVEPILGARHLLGLYVGGNVLGGVAQWAAMAGGLTAPGDLFLGVSAGVAAVVAAYATILPELEVTVLLLFVVRAKRFTLGLIALAALLWVAQVGTVVGPAALVVGTLVGWAYAKHLGFGNPTAVERYFLERRQHRLRLERMPAEQFIVEEMDPILEKLSRSGAGSLSRAERRILQQGSAKLAGKMGRG